MDEAAVPTVSTLDDVYPKDAVSSQRERWNLLLSSFKKQYGRNADFVARSPGRVNIIGEHIDYSLYECLPMAITADVLLAVSVSSASDHKITIANTKFLKFPTRTFDIPSPGTDLEVDANAHDWSNYFKAGLRGAYELLKRTKGEQFKSVGMDVLMDGNVPAGGGLSSSAAFVCAASLASVRANGVEKVNGKELVECAIVSERLVGVNSGGMDQSASVLSRTSSGLLLSFSPELHASPITIPTFLSDQTTLTFLIAQSHITSNKAETGPIHYNLRVVECTLAALVLARFLRLPESAFPPKEKDASPLGVSLRSLHEAFVKARGGRVPDPMSSPEEAASYRAQLSELEDLANEHLTQIEGYSRAEIAQTLSITVGQLEERYMSKVPVRAERFKLRQRALHVFSEAARVQDFVKLLRDNEEGKREDSPGLFKELGMLVNGTQDSCREVYECSCPELDQICEIATRDGAYGARLTGAGWGGCVVCLCPGEKVDAVRKAWEREYYAKRWPEMGVEAVKASVVVSAPGPGSVVVKVEGRDVV